jgi:peptidoglycan/xylan/chitin deacetylase (PgdA/CDA1 family)
MDWSHARELAKDGFSTLGAHCQNHFNLRALRSEDKYQEIVGSKGVIENQIGALVNIFSYPGGGYDETCLEIVSKYFSYGFKDRYNEDDADPVKVARIGIDARHNSFKTFLVELASARHLEL